MMKRVSAYFLLLVAASEAFSPISQVRKPSSSALEMVNARRGVLQQLVGALAVGAAAPTTAWAMESEDYSNDFIQKLKARSDGKDYAAEKGDLAWKKLSTKKFSQQYERPNYLGIKRSDGTIEMLEASEVKALEDAGKVITDYETYTDKAGKVQIDYLNGKVYRYVE